MKWLKIIGVSLIIFVLIGGIVTYFALKSMGVIPTNVYETEPPLIPPMNRPAVLVLNKANGFVHTEALPAADTMLQRIAEQRGWDIFISSNAATHNADVLAQFDLVVWNNVSGDVLTEAQRASLISWIELGGGWLGIHAAGGDPSYLWDWYVETLIGAQFVGHTMDPQFQDADVLVADPSEPVTSHLQSPWRIPQEEWYAFDKNPRELGYEILLTLDESSYITVGKTLFGVDNMPGEHPIAWRHRQGEGRVFYSAIGHQAASYDIPEYQEFIARGMQWAMIEKEKEKELTEAGSK